MPLCNYANFWISVYHQLVPGAYIKDVVKTLFVVAPDGTKEMFYCHASCSIYDMPAEKYRDTTTAFQLSLFCIIIMLWSMNRRTPWVFLKFSGQTVVGWAGNSCHRSRRGRRSCCTSQQHWHAMHTWSGIGLGKSREMWCQHANSRSFS